LKDKRLGIKFRRQHSVGGYILDFYCREKKLVIEIDGGVHLAPGAREYDEVRDKFFRELDYRVLRFRNDEVEENIKRVIEKIQNYLK
jgi:very-short-patch-repair endonuclease